MKRFWVILLFAFFSSFVHAAQAKPVPVRGVEKKYVQVPPKNPHPPQTSADRRRVAFAVAEIRKNYGQEVEIRHAHVVPWSFENFLKKGQVSLGGDSPELQADEYIVHAYVKYPHIPDWFNVEVVISEDDSGHLTRRRFFSFPVPPTPLNRYPPPC
ncbi:MAG TPA: hypothetical protein DF383_00975 [Deltaproteobacteria bacterium]|nr:hypothetical protein [Deltaproteobacteria bacterium]